MAVNISIPGIGMVQAENAATEATLRQLVQAMGAQQTRSRRADSEIAQSTKQQAGFADRVADSMGQVAQNAKSSESASRSLFSNLQENINRVSLAGSDIKDSGAATYLKQLGATAVEVSALWAKNFGEMPNNPVKAATGLLSTGISAASDALAGLGKAVIPKDFKDMEGAVTATTKVLAAGLQVGVGLLSKELNDSIKMMNTFNKMGAGFAGGVQEMRRAAFDAGMNVDQFTATMERATPNLKLMGMTTAGAINKVSDVAFEFGRVKTGGETLRNQLRGLGYTVEEQSELAAQYLANQRATMTAEQFKNIDSRKVAEQTRQYAVDLKVLADITGKNAKAAMEEARVKSMEADIMAQLSPEEATKFQAAYAAMPDYAKKGFLEYVSSGGQAITDQATNIGMAQNAQFEQLIKGSYASIKDANMSATTINDQVLKQVSVVGAEQQRIVKESGGGIIAMANRLGASGLGEISSLFNSMLSSGLYSKEAVDKSRQNQESMAELNNKLTKDIIKFQDNVQNYSISMSAQLGSFLQPFTETLSKMTFAMNSFVVLTTQGILGKAPPAGSRPGAEATEPYSKDQYLTDLAALAKLVLVPVLQDIQDWLKAGETRQRQGMARGGVATGPMTGYPMTLHGTEAVIPLADGSVPVQLSGTTGSADLAGVMQQMQATFSAAVAASVKSTLSDATKNPAKEQIKELPEALTAALETVLSGPAGLTEIMTAVKSQIAEDSRTQTGMLQQQIDNLVKLVDAMNDNIRVNERIANELA
jgi:hypothetical protein